MASKKNATNDKAINLTATAEWKALVAHQKDMSNKQMKDMFKRDPKRFDKYSIKFKDILFDYSKNRINDKTMKLLQVGVDDLKPLYNNFVAAVDSKEQ